jgi:hypothetical protein
MIKPCHGLNPGSQRQTPALLPAGGRSRSAPRELAVVVSPAAGLVVLVVVLLRDGSHRERPKGEA